MSETIGGQAVIEGVMMKSNKKYCVAVRCNDGKIKLKTQSFKSITAKHKFLGLPFIRGIFVLIETLVLGIKTLTYSANVVAQEDGEEISMLSLFFTILFSIFFGVALFVLLPLFLANFIAKGGILFNVADGVLRLIVFFIYVIGISFFKDVRRVFQYHGAEHKAVNCYDAKLKLTLENVKKKSTIHPRCGTSFLMIVLLISIAVFSFIPAETLVAKFLVRIVFLPIIAGCSYEFLKLSDRFRKSKIIWLISLPGLVVQRITTKEPDEEQIEVAIEALKEVTRG
jgi:uncharacterized protein YqhQ